MSKELELKKKGKTNTLRTESGTFIIKAIKGKTQGNENYTIQGGTETEALLIK